ncbi:MAG: glycosyltransferase family 9 protein [Acidobacteriia bacterium]|nr:glycosyltransferase family 9 protein [Terriglobia bacterium]
MSAAKRRLLVRPGAIGDVILSLPTLEAARASYTEVWAPRPMLPLIRFADRTRAIADTGLELVGVVEGARISELETFDSIYSWYGTHRPEFRDAVRHLPFTFFPALPPPVEGIPHIAVPPAPIQDFAIIHPFASSVRKRWPLENFREVAAELGIPVKWCAGPEEHLPDEIQSDAIKIDDLYELARWISTARVYIGNDSGIAHLAAAVGTPVVAIFLASDPRVWAPRGHRITGDVTVLECPSVAEVLAAARSALRQHASGFLYRADAQLL